MKECKDLCKDKGIECPITDCKHWIDFKDDLNCTLIAVDKNGRMTLREVGDRLGISFVRVKQIEDKAQKKLLKKIYKKGIL